MKKEWYSFANRLSLSGEDVKGEELDEMTKKHYESFVLAAIQNEQQNINSIKQQFASGKHCGAAVAAVVCLVLLGGTTAVFHEEVHAAISHFSYSLSTALGLENDIAQYAEVIRTSRIDKGYVVTLQEAAASQEALVISYTIQREDGQPIPDSFGLDGALYVNGKPIYGGVSGSSGFLDAENKCLGVEISYDVPGTDLSAENTYELKFTAYNSYTAKDDIGGHWNFKFKADGSELLADTKFVTLKDEFVLSDGRIITLDTFSDNPLEQRITYHISNTDTKGSCLLLKLTATDEEGRTAVFTVSQSSSERGYLLNEKMSENGRIPADAKAVTATLYVQEFPEESGKESNDYTQIGEPVIWDMTN